MKKKINPQSASFNSNIAIVLSVCLTAVFVALGGTIPGTHAVPASPKQSAIGQSRLPTASSGAGDVRLVRMLPLPKAPLVVLYDQYDNAGLTAISSQDFEPLFDAKDSELADDFIVPAGEIWSVESIDVDGLYFNGLGPADNFNVVFYTDSSALPGTAVASRVGSAYVQSGSTFTITLSPAFSLAPATYWVSVQARMDFSAGGQWGWTDRTVQSNNGAAWQNPGGFFGVCPTWGRRGADCALDPTNPDQVFRLTGTAAVCSPDWQSEPSLNNARRNAATTVAGSYLYAITGFNSLPDYTNVNERFDGTTW